MMSTRTFAVLAAMAMTALTVGCTTGLPPAPKVQEPSGCCTLSPTPSLVPSPFPTAPPTVSPGPGPQPIADEGHVSYSETLTPGECHARDNGTLPDPACTPGSVDPAVTQDTISQTICVRGWTSTVRPPVAETNQAKFDVTYPAYSIPAGTGSELDHLVPLELGGSNDISNLWPEVGPVPNVKDPVENDLHADVCAGELTLAAARQAVAADWYTVP
jgi:hypothetical protein